MHMLESAMAFAVVMIIFSTIVTGLVEAMLRTYALRQRTLGRTLKLFLKTELQPDLEEALKQAKSAVQTVDDAASKIEKMVKDFTANPVKSERKSWLARVFAPRLESIDELTSYSFLQRLAKSEMSETIRQLDDAQLNNYLANITRTYDRYMAASTEFYRKKSHILTVLVAMSLAIIFNVPAARVYMHLMDNPETRVELINNADQAIADNKEAQAEMRQFWLEQEQIAKGVLPSASDDQAETAEVEQKITALRDTLESLRTDTGLPIGPSLWPYCAGTKGAEVLECSPEAEEQRNALSYLYWLFNVLLAGALIGLGGPFWAKVYTRLAQFAGRPLAGASDNPELVGAEDAGLADPKKAAQNPAAAFRIAAGDVTVKIPSAPKGDQTG